ncbi:nucleotidyltransferase family protein [Pelovirga terrestris]|uniref:Nucleotidyltransferase family protein n=1 Tax=Pelovirga terrestris TaxID=2771352 RepID=A0A8J6QLI7_9BACT|nr:nucleotidyltransferase family protein [Pelovirga terrestris]MBD1399337.1 nucleotidyltransferase family protein [Pelovirga terrestris]
MTTQMENTLISILKKHDADRIGIFGSRARGDDRPDSDLDLLVDFRKTKSLLTLVSIEQELSDSLGIKVDLLTEKAISPHLIDRIKAELKVVYQ